MAIDLEIISNLREKLKFAVIRTSNHGCLYMNDEALAMFGFSSMTEASGCSRRMLFAEGDAYLHLSTKQKAYGVLSNERVLFNRRDHSNFWGLLTSRLHEVKGEMYFDEIIFDVSEEVVNEHKLSEKTHLLEKVANELDRFIYSASHDLRSPISTMKGLMTLMEMDISTFSFEHFSSMMNDSLGRLETFINRLVEFSKNSNDPVRIELVDLAEVVSLILDNLKKHPNAEKVSVECRVPDESYVYSDFNKMYTALYHVIQNAFDYLDPSKTRPILAIKSSICKDKVTVEVVDNGVGIDREHIPTVFQMFHRASNLSKGSGLGLYLAREAVVRLQGSIEINSELNLGTFVTLQIPNAERNGGNKHLKMA